MNTERYVIGTFFKNIRSVKRHILRKPKFLWSRFSAIKMRGGYLVVSKDQMK